MDKDALVSIILPSYNLEKYISETINSVLSQTYSHWELLITDDCSTDSTVDIIQQFAMKDSRIKLFVLERNSGAGIARNNSIKKASGRYIAFLDGDDWWYPDKLKIQMRFIEENGYEFIFSAFEYADENLDVIGVSYKPKRISYNQLKVGCNIGTPGVIYDTKRIGKLYMPQIRKRQDWAMWLQISKYSRYAYSINVPLWKYRLLPGSLSSNKLKLVPNNLKIYTDCLGYSKWKAYLIFVFLFLPNHLLKILKNKMDSFFYVRENSFKMKQRVKTSLP